jgi:hypothetical protein
MTETTTNVFKGNLGFYPCSFETMKKLKEINKYFHWMEGRKTQIERMMRKLPHNRLKKYPVLDKNGVFTGFEYKPWVQPEVCEYPSGLYNNVQRARTPKLTAESVVPLDWTEEHIDNLVEKMRALFPR